MREMDLTIADDAAAGVRYERVSTVFFGGGTPTLLPARDLVKMLNHLRSLIPLSDGAEVTVEANPDSVSRESLEELSQAGVSRVSFGMQSAVPRVLRVLDRTHKPELVPTVVQWAREAGLQVSLDMIYGTPSETLEDVAVSVNTILGLAPDHVSAYSLIIEGNTKMARQLRRGEIPAPDEDFMADAYDMIAGKLESAGFSWYEVSNFASSHATRSRHNLSYWRGGDWWGIGPGAHRHRRGYRAWNLKHPSRYASMLEQGQLPVGGSEHVSPHDRHVEDLMLRMRLAEGFAVESMPLAQGPDATRVLAGYVARGLLDGEAWERGVVRVSDAGRLMADAMTRDLVALTP